MKNNYRFRKVLFLVFTVTAFIIFAAGAFFQDYKEKEKKVEPKLKVEKKEETKKEETKKEEAPEQENFGPADTVKIGAYVLSVYDLDFPGNKVDVDFYLWYNAKKDSLGLIENLEIINATEYEKTGETNEKRGNIVYQTVRINSKIKEEWDVTDFPFDEQTVEVYIEDFDKNNTRLVFIADTIASKIDKSISINGWKIKDFGIKTKGYTYETNYGDPAVPLNEYMTYSRTILYFTIEREGHGLFFKLFIGLFISVLISMLTFFVNPMDLDPRFGLPLGAIFASIASQYVITSTLPQNATLTLVDILHDISYIYIFLCILVSTISLHYMKNGREKFSHKLDRSCFFAFIISYMCLVIYFVLTALN